ncbi:MAG TPA: glycosyltransferase family 4 protein [Terriglobia bacterium]|nr:glycosyltransferase family 4 protein [Terriglobia bacterium]
MTETNHQPMIAYIVKVWPRLSETFILNEIISLEQRGVTIRIFSVKEPDSGPSHNKVAQVRAKVTYIALRPRWKQAMAANLRFFSRRPGPYLRVLLQVLTGKLLMRHFNPPRLFFQAGYLADILSRVPIDHLHAHFASTPARVTNLASRLTGIPYTFTAHAKDLYLSDPQAFRVKLEAARAVVTCTQYNRDFLSERYGPLCDGKVQCIYHGIDTSQFKFTSPRSTERAEPMIILSVARLVEKKGLGDLIAAAEILRRRGRVFQMEIVGSGPLRETLKAQVKRLELADRVRLLGAQAHEAVCLAYQRASVFALPCVIASNGDRDGIPNVLLEAMASGVPVVSTPVSGIPELIESGVNGLLVAPNDPAALADAIDSLLASRELREQLARVARAKVESSFSLDASAERLVALFRGGEQERPSVSRSVSHSVPGSTRTIECGTENLGDGATVETEG